MNVRFDGMILAAIVSLALVLAPLDKPVVGSLYVDVAVLGVVGAPLAALLGWWLAPAATSGSWRFAIGVGAGMGLLAAPLGAWELAYIGILAELAGADGVTSIGGVSAVLFVATFGLPYSVVVMPVTVGCGIAWAVLMRGIIRRIVGSPDIGAPSIGVAQVGVVLVVVALGAALARLATSR